MSFYLEIFSQIDRKSGFCLRLIVEGENYHSPPFAERGGENLDLDRNALLNLTLDELLSLPEMSVDELPEARAFDSFIKLVIKGAALDGFRKKRKRLERESFFSEMLASELTGLVTVKRDLIEDDIFVCRGVEFSIDNPVLANAIRELDDGWRDIILMYSFLGMEIKEIAVDMNMALSTVYLHRKKAFDMLRFLISEEVSYE